MQIVKIFSRGLYTSLLGLALVSSNAIADNKIKISGSDTLAGAMTEAIINAGLNDQITYVGGGSGVGEKALVSGEIGITAMSRAFKPELITQLDGQGVQVVPSVIGLDGLGIYVNQSNSAKNIDFSSLVRIFSCEYKTWEQVPGSGKTGPIAAFRRNDQSGTTDTFKHLLGVKSFGDCVQILQETQDIAERTAKDPSAIGYAGLSAKIEGNKLLSIAVTAAGPFVAPNTTTIRNASYPLSRNLYVYSISGARNPNDTEQKLLDLVTDRSFMDPIMQNHEFITID
jgi:phosphate transport system substrate-binding protein